MVTAKQYKEKAFTTRNFVIAVIWGILIFYAEDLLIKLFELLDTISNYLFQALLFIILLPMKIITWIYAGTGTTKLILVILVAVILVPVIEILLRLKKKVPLA